MVAKRTVPSSTAAVRQWEALSPQAQLATVREICGHRGPQLMARFDGVLAVGAGYKKSGDDVSDTICLGLLVNRKRKGKLQRPVPERLLVTVVRDGKRIRLSIPTDVEELAAGQPHAAVNLAKGVRAFNRKNPAQGVPGAVCCIVSDRQQPADRYLLGCHHVLALSLERPGCTPVRETDVADRGMNTRVGELFLPLPMAPDGQPCLDAALTLAHSNVEIDWLSDGGIKPQRVEPGIAQPMDCFVFTPDGRLKAEFVKEWANVPLRYRKCGIVVIAAAYQFKADTVGGHSGSPVMTTDGTLHGMHFWGDSVRRMAMAIPAFVLFQAGLFPIDFELA